MNAPQESEVFRPTKTVWIFAFLGAALLLASDIWMLHSPKQIDRFVALGTIGVAGLGVILAPLILLPNCSFLQVDKNGLTIRVLWRTTFYRWADIEQFGLVELPNIYAHGFSRGGLTVGFKLSKSYLDSRPPQKMANVNKILLGFNGILPETYGWRAAELAEHLNCLHDQYSNP